MAFFRKSEILNINHRILSSYPQHHLRTNATSFIADIQKLSILKITSLERFNYESKCLSLLPSYQIYSKEHRVYILIVCSAAL